MNYEELQNDIKQNAVDINTFIANNMQISVPNLKEACYHLFGAGGKRIRPYIMTKAYEIFCPRNSKIVPIASALEVLHTFTLIHDDIMDQDAFRRGIPTVHVKWGENLAILAGDVLHALVFSILGNSTLDPTIKARLLAEFSKSTIKICEGQVLDIQFESEPSVSVNHYINMVKLKTGELLGLAAKSGGIVAEVDLQIIESLSEFGINYGIAFQMRDDILGMTADESEFGKPVGSDLRQGKKTFLTLYALENLNETLAAELASFLAQVTKNDLDIARGIALIKKSGAIKEAEAKTEYYSKLALQNLAQLPQSSGRAHLEKLVEFSLKRDY